MARERSPKRKDALEIWLKSGKEKKPKEIAEELGISSSQVRKWKSIDKWEEIDNNPTKRGAPSGNKNAIGNKGGPGGPIGNQKALGNKGNKDAKGAPKDNEYAVKHGMFRKWLPNDEELKEIYDAAREGMSSLDILYEEILISFTNFIHAQKIMFVKDQDDITKEIKKQKSYSDDNSSSEEIEYEIQFAWDKQAKALTSQAAASRALSNKIKQYEEMVRTLPPEEVKEEHRLRVSKLKVDIKAAESKGW